jgi:hypothetical protein
MSSINGLDGQGMLADPKQLVTKWVNTFGRQYLFGMNYKF